MSCFVCGQNGHKSKHHTKRDWERRRNNTAMPHIESGVLNIRSVITRCRSVSQHRTSGVNADKLVTLTNGSLWSIPGFLNVNTRSLSIENLHELLALARMNDVAYVNVTEAWLKFLGLRRSRMAARWKCTLCVHRDHTPPQWRHSAYHHRHNLIKKDSCAVV